MAWNPQGGGQGPWGGGPSKCPQPPDIEELLRRGQASFKRFIPGGIGTLRGLLLSITAALAIFIAPVSYFL